MKSRKPQEPTDSDVVKGADPAGPGAASLSWSEQMAELDRRRRRVLLLRCGAVGLVLLGTVVALCAMLKMKPAGPVPVFDFRGVELRSSPQPGMLAVTDEAAPVGLRSYRREGDSMLLLGLPVERIRYLFDEKEVLLRRIEIDLQQVELGMKAAEEIDRALAEKFGEHYPAGRIKTSFLDGAKGLSQCKKANLPGMGVRVLIEQDCVAIQREGSGVYEVTPASACQGRVVFSDSRWKAGQPPKASGGGL